MLEIGADFTCRRFDTIVPRSGYWLSLREVRQMATIVITEFMDARAVALLRSRHEVRYDEALVDDPPGLLDAAVTPATCGVRMRFGHPAKCGAGVTAEANGRVSLLIADKVLEVLG